MINDLTESLAAMVRGAAVKPSDLANADIAYDRPVESFNPARPTLNLFLFDVRENLELRSNEPVVERVAGQIVTRRSPLRVACSYLVTAWPGNLTGETALLGEQGLLSQALMVFARFPFVPDVYLKGSLANQPQPPPMVTAQAAGMKDPSEFWTALGNKLRPSLSVTVTITLQPFDAVAGGPPVVTSVVHVGLPDPAKVTGLLAATQLDSFTIGGTVSVGGKPAPGASLSLSSVKTPARKFATVTDAAGRFRVTGITAPGDYTATVTAGAATKTQNIHIASAAEIPAGSYDIVL